MLFQDGMELPPAPLGSGTPCEGTIVLKEHRKVYFRPLLPTDEPLLVDLFHRLSSDTLYLRFLRPLRFLPSNLLHQLTHIDYDRHFALVALTPENGRDSIIAVARYGLDPDEALTDFAIVIRDDWQRLGLGIFLLSKLFAIGREHGISRFVSVIEPTNHAIKLTLRKLGHAVKYSYRKGSTQVEVLPE